MARRKLTVQLMGGLGNQLFQYAAGRDISHRNGMELYIDSVSGFKSDKLFRRNFELERFPIRVRQSGLSAQIVFQAERVWNRLFGAPELVNRRPWGNQIIEKHWRFDQRLQDLRIDRTTYMRGYWQSEKYFESSANLIREELTPPSSQSEIFQKKAQEIVSCHGIGVGVRLFEEVPKDQKCDPTSITPIEFYRKAAEQLPNAGAEPVFYVFCTHRFPVLETLKLPGKTVYVTHDDGFVGAVDRLWLMSHCKHFLVSHSSFYWWAAWFGENPNSRIIASEAFPGLDTIPERWTKIGL